MSVNKVILVGRLGKDPELKTLNSGSNICNMSLATSSKRNDKEITDWHRIVAFNTTADNCERYLSKGSLIYVEGRLQTRSWENKQGQKQYTTEIVANIVQFLDTKKTEEPKWEEEDEHPEIPF